MSTSSRIIIRPELSAQGIKKHPNPMLPRVFAELERIGFTRGRAPLIVDCGCGQLRNIESLLLPSSKIVLVDTLYQLNVEHDFYGKRMKIPAFVKHHWPRKRILVMSSEEYVQSFLEADIIFSINVLDVTPPKTRNEILRACLRNLGTTGVFVAVVPRNDTWTLRICTPEAKYNDGYVFRHSRGYTYYRNWNDKTLHSLIEHSGFSIIKDLSVYRQVCLICKKKTTGQ